MSDHADTIRREWEALLDGPADASELSSALSQCMAERKQMIERNAGLQTQLADALAERQQAIDERDAARESLRIAHRQWNTAEEELAAADREVDALCARCEQAIDALRFYAHRMSYENASPRHVRPVITDGGQIARDALVSLGEKPTP